jgi:cbb3-type cytochrome oxidase subunit 3
MLESLIHYAPTIATVFFFLAFCYIIYTVFKKGSKEKLDKFSQIPLNDNDEPKQ